MEQQTTPQVFLAEINNYNPGFLETPITSTS